MSRKLTPEMLADMAAGAAIMATGGGGDPLVGRLLVQQALDEGMTVEIVDPDELDDDDFVISTAMMGAPSVVVEKLSNRLGNGLISGWRTATDLTANRVGLIVANDLETAALSIATD